MPKSASEFIQLSENDFVPLLLKQKGFRDEVTLIAPGRYEALAINMLDTKENTGA